MHTMPFISLQPLHDSLYVLYYHNNYTYNTSVRDAHAVDNTKYLNTNIIHLETIFNNHHNTIDQIFITETHTTSNHSFTYTS